MARNQISSIAFGQVNSAVRILPGASVNVASQSGAAVTLYQTEEGSETFSNPFTCDALGRYEFFVSSSEVSYTITVTLGPVSYSWVYYTPDNTAAAGLIYEETWSDLVGRSADIDGAAAEVINDAGTHLDATDTGYDGGEVANLGRYRWNAEWSRWERLPDLAPVLFGQPYDSPEALEAANVPGTISVVRVVVDGTVLDYTRSDDPADIQSADAQWWVRVPATDIGSLIPFSSRSDAEAAIVPNVVTSISVYSAQVGAGDRSIAKYVEADSGELNPALTTADGRKWVPDGDVRPEHFGWNSSLNATESTNAVSSAISYIRSIGGGALKFGPHNYLISSTISINFSDFSIIGDGVGLTQLRTGTNTTMFNIRADDMEAGGELENISIRDVEIVNTTSTAQSSALAVYVGVVRGFVLRDCKITGFYNQLHLDGAREPSFVIDNQFYASDGFTTNTGSGGGYWLKISAPLVDAGAFPTGMTSEDPDNAGAYYLKPSMIWVTGNNFYSWKDSIDDGVVIECVDGLKLEKNHFLRSNGAQVSFNPQSAVHSIWNFQVSENHFDGADPYTQQNIIFQARGYTTKAMSVGAAQGMRGRVENNQFDGASSRAIQTDSDDIFHLTIKGNTFRNAPADTWIDLRTGGGDCLFTENSLYTKAGVEPTNMIIAGDTSASTTWDHVVISHNTFTGATETAPSYWIHPTNEVNRLSIANNVYVAASGVSGDGLLWDQTTAGVVDGAAEIMGNYEIGRTSALYQSGSITPTVRFATPGDSSFTYTTQVCQYVRTANIAHIQLQVAFSTNAYTTASGTFLVDLSGIPFEMITGSTPALFSVESSNVTLGGADIITCTATNTALLRLNLVTSGAGAAIAGTTNIPPSTSNIVIKVSGSTLVS